MAKNAKVDALVCVLKITFPLEPNGYDAASKAIEAVKVEGGQVEIVSKALARIPAPVAAPKAK